MRAARTRPARSAGDPFQGAPWPGSTQDASSREPVERLEREVGLVGERRRLRARAPGEHVARRQPVADEQRLGDRDVYRDAARRVTRAAR